MRISQKQIEAVSSLSRDRRYEHFIKRIVNTCEVWSLFRQDWALAINNENMTFFPLWPAREYAQLCAINEWSGYEPKLISLAQLTEEIIPELQFRKILPGIFFTPNDHGVTPSIESLIKAIETELEWYQ